ncbi:MAG: hypothetical protein JW896_11880 [Deltaproteobacteria bacterium]|nr:hypothetical protein [Deltaproteobacteria bacterium]
MNGDLDRIYTTGTSMGGPMTYTLSCYLPEKIAAIAPVLMQMGTALIKELKIPAVPLKAGPQGSSIFELF